MRKFGACLAIGALAAAAFLASPTAAFVVRIGPYHISFPFHRHRHHHQIYARKAPNNPAPEESTPGGTSTLLYPQLALPAILGILFSPADVSWPFDYRAIFSAAFAEAPAHPIASQCRQQPDLTAAILRHIHDALEPTDAQMQLLQNLGGALDAASAYLAASCANEIPAQPVARLQFVESQIKKLATAADAIREPLKTFQQSLNEEQRARFAVLIAPPASEANRSAACSGAAAAVDWSVDQIDRSVQPTDAQRDIVNDLKTALAKAASDLEAQCQSPLPPSAPSRLETIESRLDATRQGVASTRTALAEFETKLSEEQKNRFDAMHVAAR